MVATLVVKEMKFALDTTGDGLVVARHERVRDPGAGRGRG
jgi:hypothetical protein